MVIAAASVSRRTGKTFVSLLRGSDSLPKALRLRRRHPEGVAPVWRANVVYRTFRIAPGVSLSCPRSLLELCSTVHASDRGRGPDRNRREVMAHNSTSYATYEWRTGSGMRDWFLKDAVRVVSRSGIDGQRPRRRLVHCGRARPLLWRRAPRRSASKGSLTTARSCPSRARESHRRS